MSWPAAHGGDVADGAARRLPADGSGRCLGVEVDGFDDDIGFHELPSASTRRPDDGAIVAGAGDDARSAGEMPGKEGDEAVFTQFAGGGFHGDASWSQRRAMVAMLKRAWMATGSVIPRACSYASARTIPRTARGR